MESPEANAARRRRARVSKGGWVGEALQWARKRAKKAGVEFSITAADIWLPDVCPVFGTPIVYDQTFPRDNRPSLDRTDNSLGYIPGNVRVISFRANRLKNDASAWELEQIVAYLRLSGVTGTASAKPEFREALGHARTGP